MNINDILNEHIDESYKKFHQRICQTNYKILGIKIPILRKISKDLLKQYNYKEILKNLNSKYYEHIMLQGLVIANAKVSYEEKLNLINNFLPLTDNWAICDIFISELKFIKNNKEGFLEYILNILNNKNEYYQRFCIVVLLNYYINDDYIDFVLSKMLEVKSDYYYVKMAISWCLSICLIKYFDKTIKFLNDNKYLFDKWTYNKALQKGIESFRITNENKEILRNMKL